MPKLRGAWEFVMGIDWAAPDDVTVMFSIEKFHVEHGELVHQYIQVCDNKMTKRFGTDCNLGFEANPAASTLSPLTCLRCLGYHSGTPRVWMTVTYGQDAGGGRGP